MRYFTKDEITEIEQYNIVEHFNTSIYSQYVIGVTKKEVDILNKVWLQANSNTPNSLYNWNCNTCALKNFKLIGKHYYASKKQIELTQPKETIVELIKQPTKITTVTKKPNTDGKKGRKKGNTK